MHKKPKSIKSGEIGTELLFDILDDRLASAVNGLATAFELTDSLLDDAEQKSRLDEKAVIRQVKVMQKWSDEIKSASGDLQTFKEGLKDFKFDQDASKKNSNINPKKLTKWIKKTAADLTKEELGIQNVAQKVLSFIDGQKKVKKKDELVAQNIRHSILDGIKVLDRINTNLFDQKVGLAEMAGIDGMTGEDSEMGMKSEFGSSLFDDDFDEPPKERSSPRLAFLEQEKSAAPVNFPGIAEDVLKLVNLAEQDLRTLEEMMGQLTKDSVKGEKKAIATLQETGEVYGQWALNLDETKDGLIVLEEELARRAMQNVAGDPEESMDFVRQTKNVKKVKDTLDSVATSLDQMTEKISELIGKSKPSEEISLKFLAILKKPNTHWLGQLMGVRTTLTLLKKDLKEIL